MKTSSQRIRLTISSIDLGVLLILTALFLWFALAFNGSVGSTLVNYSLFSSAFFMLILGVLKIINAPKKALHIFGSLTIILYLPLIWQRFDTNWYELSILCFDFALVSMVIYASQQKQKSATDTN